MKFDFPLIEGIITKQDNAFEKMIATDKSNPILKEQVFRKSIKLVFNT